MPHDADGQPLEVLLNPLGIPSRTNPSQLVESVLGKIAAKRGQPYRVQDFEGISDLSAFAEAEARKYGVKDLETVTDPELGIGIPNIMVGNRFFMKLHHTAEGKLQGRSTGGYTAEGTPSKGGQQGSKLVSLMDNNALLAHSATEVARDAGAIRGQRDENFWLTFMQGNTPPPPRIPMVYQKFVNQLRGAGIQVIPQGKQTHIMALTDKDIDTLAGDRYLSSGDTVKFEKGLEPIKGGLFDETLTGGHGGNRWSAIKLTEPLPSPVMEEPIRRLLGLTTDGFRNVLTGKAPLGEFGTGPGAIARRLEKIDIDKELAVTRLAIASGRKTARDAAIRKLGYLKSAKRLGIHPRDWVLSKAPVLPPIFRPVTTMSDKKLPLVADANYLYKELMEANDNLRDMSGQVDDVSEERAALYDAFKAVVGLGDPVHPKLQEKKVRGILQHVFGSSPKFGTLQRKLLSSSVDLVGRAVIAPNPDLDMDHIGLPETAAWDIYRPFVVRRLKRRGMPLVQALEQVEQKSGLARQELLNEMDLRPVITNRAPVLHRFGVMAFKPVLVKGDTLQISPLVVKPFGADFDGDAMQFHVPFSDEARDEALEKMLPSRNLISPSNFKSPLYSPSQEYVGGLYAATSNRREVPLRVFRSAADAVAAFRRGDLRGDEPIEILQSK